MNNFFYWSECAREVNHTRNLPSQNQSGDKSQEKDNGNIQGWRISPM